MLHLYKIPNSAPECETGAVRLVGGATNSTGRLEVCGNRIWGRVCNRLQYWGPDNARVVCRQLGFFDEGTVQFLFAFTLNLKLLKVPMLCKMH